jgi:hypothetical protein
VSDIELEYYHNGCLTVDSHAEALTLAQGAASYINATGAAADLFITYFGPAQDSTTQLRVFSVCPGYPDSQRFPHSTPIQDAADENTLALFPIDPHTTCASNTAIGDFGAYGTGSSIVWVLTSPPYNSANLVSPTTQLLPQLLQPA